MLLFPAIQFGLIVKCDLMLIHCWSLNTFCGEQDQSMLFQTIMIVTVSGRRYFKISVWISTITRPLTNSLIFTCLMASPSLILQTQILLFQVVCVFWFGGIGSILFFLWPLEAWCWLCVECFADVPEGSFIVRAHTPMSNLFSCLWFNEVDRFTSRDQLSFAYTYLKLRRSNPDGPFYLNMFKVIYCLINLWIYVTYCIVSQVGLVTGNL